ncbi:MAG TPA: 50S ribosomal protein L21 [Polyangiaceae bacterium]|jgi:large subunit ribosomal protein L21|nr:50S ribosomal protein L21 [Polyangiaceae bacterium]
MVTAVIRTGGKQYRVAEGDLLSVELLQGAAGDPVEFSDVLLVGGDVPKIGTPLVAGAKVTGEIVRQDRGERLIVFKFKRRKRYKRKNGHRQYVTAVKITSIQG